MRAPGASRTSRRTSSSAATSSPASSATRSRSDAAKSVSPRMVDSVILATCSAQPARAASRSIASPEISVESTSMTIRRIARRCRPPRWTATSTRCSAASMVSAERSASGSAPDTSSSMQVTGRSASRSIRSMLAPLAAIRPAMAATALGRSGLPSTVTCSRPRRGGGSPQPVVISASMSRSAASARTARWIAVRSGSPSLASRTPSTRRPRMTTCSMSRTASSCPARSVNSREVTPGRSRPVRVTRTVVSAAFIARNATVAQPLLRPPGCLRGWPGDTAFRTGSCSSGQEQVDVAELVPEVLVLDGGRVAAAQQGFPGECVKHVQMG